MSNVPVSATMLLIRATELTERVRSFADSLERASGCTVAYVVDARSRPKVEDGRLLVGVSRASCQSIGLHCPPQFAWSCGDYGYYLARRMFPQVRHFWLIEHDVRFSGSNAADFFAFFAAHPEVDLLASYLRDAEANWYWTHTAKARGLSAKRCFFPVTRLSAEAVDLLYEKRLQHSRRLLRQLTWPNDEAMVASTLIDAGLICRDINSFGRTFYSTETFSYYNVIDGDTVDWSAGPTALYHPVLYGEQYAAKLRQFAEVAVAKPSPGRLLVPKLATRLNRLSAW